MSSNFKCFELQVIVAIKNIQLSVTSKILAPDSELIGLIFCTNNTLLRIHNLNLFFKFNFY